MANKSLNPTARTGGVFAKAVGAAGYANTNVGHVNGTLYQKWKVIDDYRS
jgi:hypothetical protein